MIFFGVHVKPSREHFWGSRKGRFCPGPARPRDALVDLDAVDALRRLCWRNWRRMSGVASLCSMVAGGGGDYNTAITYAGSVAARFLAR